MSRLLTERIEVVMFMALFYRARGGAGMRKKYRLLEASGCPPLSEFSV
jgi:hypothetical protein